MKNRIFSALTAMVACVMLVSCGKEEPQPTPPVNAGVTTTPTAWGKLIDVPLVDVSQDFVGNLQSTCSGVYMEVNLNSGSWIYRMNSGNEEWIETPNTETYYFWEPLNYYYESDDEFSYFYSGNVTSGLININTGDPFQLSTPHPFEFSGNTQMLIDNSFLATTWRLTWSEVQVKQPNELNLFNTLFTFPEVSPNYRAIADPTENCIWLTRGNSIIYQIYSSGTINTWDVAALTGVQGSVGKIAFSHAPDHTDVYFKFGNSYMRLDERTTLQTLYTDPVVGANSFTVDNNYLYATDGKKIDLTSGAVGTFIPPSPGFEDMALYTDYFNKTFWLAMSLDLEVLKNDGDAFIYSIYNNQVFRMPKTP